MSITEWIEQTSRAGCRRASGSCSTSPTTSSTAPSATVQSSLNLLYLLGYSARAAADLRRVEREVPRPRRQRPDPRARSPTSSRGQITTGPSSSRSPRRRRRLLARRSASAAGRGRSTADKVVLALPFSILRRSVDFSQGRLLERARGRAIAEQGMGTNSKLHVQFDRRHWRDARLNGETYADTGYQNTWEVTRAQAGSVGHPRRLHRRHDRRELRHGHADVARAAVPRPDRAGPARASAKVERPGDGRLLARQPVDKGSYSYWKVGQYTRSPASRASSRATATSPASTPRMDFQGYLNGAVESGERAAGEILDDLA